MSTMFKLFVIVVWLVTLFPIKLFSTFNISLSDAINLFLTQSVLNKGIPFKIEIPNEETQQAIQEARIGKNMEKVTFEELKKD